ncbi:MAG: DNA translocase FtsK [Clostridia bacterium]|nr:DNA translocase FtsK [Clostridia bacterium]
MANKKKKKQKPERNVDLQSLLLIAFGIIFAFIIYTEQNGAIGGIFKNFLIGGLFGKFAYALPFAFILMGIYVIFKDFSRIKIKAFQFILLIMNVCALLTAFDYNHLVDGTESNIFVTVAKLCSVGTEFASNPNAGGGLFGGILCAPLEGVFSLLVAKVIIILVLVILTFLITGIAFSSIVIGIKDAFATSIEKGSEKVKDELSARKARKELEAIEREKERALKKEKQKALGIEEEIPVITKQTKKSKNKKFNEIMEQTAVVGKGKQLTIHELDLSGLDDEEETDEGFISDEEETPEVVEEPVEELNINQKPKKKKVLKELYSEAPKNEPKEDNKAEVLNLEHSSLENYDDYIYPPLSLLNEGEQISDEGSVKELREVATKLQKTLTSFNVDAKVVNVTRGPTVTQYEVQPNSGVKVSKILGLADDIALNLAAKSIRIEAPIPGKSAVGIEVPNKTKETVYLREVIESDTFQDATSKVSFALGKSIDGEPCVSDIAKMPHMLIAGATGSGKSVCINSILVSLLYKAKPNEVKLILIDPKKVELGVYNDIPHLLIPVVTDAKKAAGALNWAVQEMVNRYNLFAAKGVRDIRGYNELLNQEGEDGVLPQIVIIVDELADLMMVAPSEVEDAICRLAQMARAAGMHLIIATQRPSVDVVTGIIKANIPSRIAFTVSSQIDSRTILDMAGAEKLLGKGDMLYYPIGESKPIRVQGTFVSDKEIESIVGFVKSHFEASYDQSVIESFEQQTKPPQAVQEQQSDSDPLLADAIELAVQMGNASASMIQRKFKVGYARAGRIIDQMEERGIVSGYDGSKPRQTLISEEEWEEMKEAGVDSVKFEEVDEDEYEEEYEDEEVDNDEEYSEEDEEVDSDEESDEEKESEEDEEESDEDEEESDEDEEESDEDEEESDEDEEESDEDEDDDDKNR